jgi:hypothetical protein
MIDLPYISKPNRLRIGVILASRSQPAWVEQILAKLIRVSYTGLSSVVLCSETQESPIRPDKPSFFWRFIRRLDRSAQPLGEAAGLKDISALLEHVPVFAVKTSGSGILPGEVLNALRQADLDLILDFRPQRPAVSSRPHTRYGSIPLPSAIPFQSFFLRNFFQFLSRLYQNGFAAVKNSPFMSLAARADVTSIETLPSLDLSFLAGRLLIDKFFEKIFNRINAERWEIAFNIDSKIDPESFTVSPQKRIIPPMDQIYGDPFPVSKDGRLYLFFELLPLNAPQELGQIVVTEIDRNTGQMGEIRPALSRPYHLSYPFVFEWEGQYYLLPETAQNRSVELYHCTSFPDQWDFCKTLLTDYQAVDVTLFEQAGLWWMFASRHQAGRDYEFSDTVDIFFAPSPLGPWQAHPQNPVKIASYGARPAGKIFEWNGMFIRPTQDCSYGYGVGVIFNRIDELTPQTFRETEIGRLLPPKDDSYIGVHTYNHLDDVTVVDLNKLRNRLFPWNMRR